MYKIIQFINDFCFTLLYDKKEYISNYLCKYKRIK